MKSSEPVFSRQNPFPPASPVKRAHYHPSRKQTLSKKEKKITLSPVRLHQRSNHPRRSLNRESQQLIENCDFPARDGQHLFTEIWPSTECESSPDRNVHFPATLPDKLSAKEDSVLAKYVERFRHGRPQSREERQQMTSTDAEEQIPFWWMSRSSAPSSTPTKSVDKDRHDSTAYSPPPQHHRSFNAASDCSQGEFDDTEILQLQERASRLLLRGEPSSSDGSIPVSSDGVGCSDFSSPVSVDEPLRQPLNPSFMKPTAAKVSPDWAPAATSQKSVIPTVTPPTRPEEDILFQWRLRRKMEQARGLSQSVKQSGLHDSAFSWQASSLVDTSASGLPHMQQSSQPPQFSERDAHPLMAAPAPSRPQPLAAVVPSPSSVFETQALSHVPAHMHLLCDVLPCPNRSSLANREQNVSQKFSEPRTKAAHYKTQASESSSSTDDGLIIDCLQSSLHASRGNEKGKVPSRQKVLDKKKKKKLVTKEPDQKMALPSRQQRKPARHSSSLSLSTKIMSLEEQHQHDESEEVHIERCSTEHVPPSSPVHAALGQVVSEVLFPPVAQKTPPSVSTPKKISPSQCTLPPYVTQNSLEVISQLLQEAEDSDGKEFEDDPLLQVLRHQRKWVKDQIREVDMMLNEFLEEQPVA